MPSTSKKQHNFMAAVAKNPKFAKKVGVPQSVGEEFLDADKGKKFRRGGTTNPMRAGINKQRTRAGMLQMPNASLTKFRGFKEGGDMKESKEMMKKEVSFMKKKGAPKSMIKHEEAEMKGMKNGGMTEIAKKEVKAHEKRMHGMAKGGVTRADGCVSKGHTKGKTIKMAYGGKC